VLGAFTGTLAGKRVVFDESRLGSRCESGFVAPLGAADCFGVPGSEDLGF
jgi:hypothetical protein